MSPLVNYILVGMAVIEALLGIRVFLREDKGEVYNKLFIGLCFGGALWCISFLCVGSPEITSNAVRFTWRNMIVFSIFFCDAMCIFLLRQLIDMSKLFKRTVLVLTLVISFGALPFAMQPDTMEFVTTEYGYSYIHHYSVGRIFFLMYEVVVCLIFCTMSLYGVRKGKSKRSRFFAFDGFLCLTIMMVGGIFDTWLQFRGDPVWPGSAIAMFVDVLIVYFASVKYAIQRIGRQNAEHYLYSIIDEKVFVVDDRGKIVHVNPAACTFLNVPENWIINHPMKEYFKLETDTMKTQRETGSYRIDATCKINGALCELRVSHVLDPFQETLGDIVAVTDCTERDRLERQLRKSEMQAIRNNEAKSNFIANMSHEMRTPLSAIMGMSEVVLKEDISGPVRVAVSNIQSAGEDLLDTLNQVLNLSKMEAGKYDIVSKSYSLSELVRRVVRLVEGQLLEKEVLFFAEINPRVPDELVGDEKSVQQILVNLLNNALQFTEQGYVKLYVDGEFEPNAEEGTLMFEISDTGRGIRVEELERMFQEFTQVDMKKEPAHHRTGLGLTISRQLARLMKGDITASSVYGEGSVFYVNIQQGVRLFRGIINEEKTIGKILMAGFGGEFNRFAQLILEDYKIGYEIYSSPEDAKYPEQFDYIVVPDEYFRMHETVIRQEYGDKLVVVKKTELGRRKNESQGIKSVGMPLFGLQMAYLLQHGETMRSETDESAATAVVENRDYSGKKILVVDDSIVNLKVLCALLKTYNVTVDTAISGAESIDMMREGTYDLVFMDHLMAELDGIATVATLRREKLVGEAHIVALTANVLSGSKQYFLENGFDDYAMKPLLKSRLDEILEKYL